MYSSVPAIQRKLPMALLPGIGLGGEKGTKQHFVREGSADSAPEVQTWNGTQFVSKNGVRFYILTVLASLLVILSTVW